MVLNTERLIRWRIKIETVGEEKPCSIRCQWLKVKHDLSLTWLLRVTIPLPCKPKPLSGVEGGVMPTEMPVHLRPTQMVGSSNMRLTFSFLRPPLLKQSRLSPRVKKGMRRCRKEISLNQKTIERGGQLSYSHNRYSLFRVSSYFTDFYEHISPIVREIDERVKPFRI
jgi:hypothetical protein